MKTLLPLLLALCLGSCGLLRPSLQEKQLRDCAKAQRILAEADIRASYLCPSAVVRDSALLAAETVEVPIVLSDSVDVRDLLAACEKFSASLIAERAQLAHRDSAQPLVRQRGMAVREAAAQLQVVACAWEPFTIEDEHVRVDVRPGATIPLVTVTRKSVKVPCPPQVERNTPPPMASTGVASGWRTFALTLFGVVLVYALYRMRRAIAYLIHLPRP